MYLILCNPWTVACQSSSDHRMLQARILEWVALPFSRGSSQPRDWIQVPCIAGRFFTIWVKRILPIWINFQTDKTLDPALCNRRGLGGNPGSSILAWFLWPAPLPPSSEDSELSLTTVCLLCPSWHFCGLMWQLHPLQPDRSRFQSHLYHILAVLFSINYLKSLRFFPCLQNRDENNTYTS